MQLRILGASGTYPTPDRPASGYLLTGAGASLLLDAGPGVAMALQTVMGPSAPDAIVLSHRHPDHCSDLFALLNLLRFGPEPRSGVRLLAPGDVIDRLTGFLGADGDHAFHRVFDVSRVGPGDSVHVGGWLVAFGAAAHPVPAVITRIAGDGRIVTYSGDTGPGGDLASLAAAADLLLCEATLAGVPDAGRYPYHLAAIEAGELAAAAGVGHLVLTHLAPTLDPEQAATQARSRFGGRVSVAVPGLVLDV